MKRKASSPSTRLTKKRKTSISDEQALALSGADSPQQFMAAVRLYLDMEQGRLGNPREWTYPPTSKDKVSHREIYYRLGVDVDARLTENIDWLRWPVFQEALELERSFRAIDELGINHATTTALDSICALGMRHIARQLVLAEAGLPSEVKLSTLTRDLPKFLRLKMEKEGEIERAGVTVNLINQRITSLQDPKARALAYKRLTEELEIAARHELHQTIEGEIVDEEDDGADDGHRPGPAAENP